MTNSDSIDHMAPTTTKAKGPTATATAAATAPQQAKKKTGVKDIYDVLGLEGSDEDDDDERTSRNPIEQRRRRFAQEEKKTKRLMAQAQAQAQAETATEEEAVVVAAVAGKKPKKAQKGEEEEEEEEEKVDEEPAAEEEGTPKAVKVAEHKQIVGDALSQLPIERTVHVANLSFDAAEEDLKALLEEQVGELEAMVFPRNNSGRPAGYAYVVFADAENVAKATAASLKLNERELRVSKFSRKVSAKRNIKPKEMRKIAAVGREKKRILKKKQDARKEAQQAAKVARRQAWLAKQKLEKESGGSADAEQDE